MKKTDTIRYNSYEKDIVQGLEPNEALYLQKKSARMRKKKKKLLKKCLRKKQKKQTDKKGKIMVESKYLELRIRCTALQNAAARFLEMKYEVM